MKHVLRLLWTFPQNLLGWLLYHCIKGKVFQYKESQVKCWSYKEASMGLGNYIFLCPDHVGNDRILKHEYGHVRQSRLLGWFYLIIIGIPSVIWAWCFEKYRKKRNIDYYSFYTEKWADHLGGVTRVIK